MEIYIRSWKSCTGLALHEELLLADRQEVVKDLALFNRSSSASAAVAPP